MAAHSDALHLRQGTRRSSESEGPGTKSGQRIPMRCAAGADMIIDVRHRGRAIAIGYMLFCVLYLGSARFGMHGATLLTPSRLDRAIPFVPWSILVYLSQFAFLFLALWRQPDSRSLTRAFVAIAIATVASCLVFVVWPTTVERPSVESPLFDGLWLFDVPVNCFPSLHVALAWIAASLWPGSVAELFKSRPGRARRRSAGTDARGAFVESSHGDASGLPTGPDTECPASLSKGLAILWAAAIALSTLTTRQHVAIDVAGGIVVGAGTVWASRRREFRIQDSE